MLASALNAEILFFNVQKVIPAAAAVSLGEGIGYDAVVAGTLRRGQGGWGRFLRSAAELFIRGVAVDWSSLFPDAHPVELPTYPFQRESYWLDPASGRDGDVTALGLA